MSELPPVAALRRELHSLPEYGWQEYRATWRLSELLARRGFRISYLSDLLTDPEKEVPDCASGRDEAKARAASEGADPDLMERLKVPGFIAMIDGALPGSAVGLRCDIDAVGVSEAMSEEHAPARLSFASRHPGLAHACGHDGHMALATHAACRIASRKERLRGSYVFLFQPAEEGCRGAMRLTDLPQIRQLDALIGFHLGICAADGEIVADPSDFLVSTKFDVEITGRSAHAGIEPEKGINALRCACGIADRLFRLGELRATSRFNIGNFASANARNVICDRVAFQCECRDRTEKDNHEIFAKAQDIIRSECDRSGCKYHLAVTGEACSIKNSPVLVKTIAESAEDLGYRVYDTRSFGACEDCGHLIRAVQSAGGAGAYFVMGNTISAGHHNRLFDLSETWLEKDVRLLFEVLTRAADGRLPPRNANR
ncbi:MAG: amidohydrolase [Succinivibrionaceae bacterium]|nr:amidohydrolase [Succinivibrionaceae bacterium]